MRSIDCLLIGHNDVPFKEIERKARLYNKGPSLLNDLIYDCVYYKNIPYSISELYNLLSEELNYLNKRINISNIFSAAIAYLGTYLDKKGYSFDYVNSFQDEKVNLEKLLLENKILTVAITTTFYLTVDPVIEIIKYIRKFDKTVPVILGGPMVFHNYRTLDEFQLKVFLRTTGANFYVNSSQGEFALSEIIRSIKHGEAFDGLNNITYFNNKKLITNKVNEENNRINENPVNWSLFLTHIGSTVSIRTTISCPYKCSFCNIPLREGAYQVTEINNLEYELDLLNNIESVSYINFVDDTFNIPPERFKDLMRMMIKKKYRFKWRCYFRCENADDEMIELMSLSGCVGVFLGMESANVQVLKNMRKFSDIKKYANTIESLKQKNIITYVSYIVGFPGETENTVLETVEFINDTKPDFINANAMYLDEHTPIWNERQKYGLIGKEYNWRHKTMDSLKANELLKKMYLTIKDVVWVPEFNFEFPGLFELINGELGLSDAKKFLNLFNDGVKAKLNGSIYDNIEETSIQSMKTLITNKVEEKYYNANHI